MSAYKVVLLRRWFGEELEQKLEEYDRFPEPGELLELAHRHQLGDGATLYVLPPKGKGPRREFKVRELVSGQGT